jgi:hypothetical protein
MEKKTAEFWKILKSLDSKKLDQNSELKELFNDIEKTVEHVQDQGRCKNNNETFKNPVLNYFIYYSIWSFNLFNANFISFIVIGSSVSGLKHMFFSRL